MTKGSAAGVIKQSMSAEGRTLLRTLGADRSKMTRYLRVEISLLRSRESARDSGKHPRLVDFPVTHHRHFRLAQAGLLYSKASVTLRSMYGGDSSIRATIPCYLTDPLGKRQFGRMLWVDVINRLYCQRKRMNTQPVTVEQLIQAVSMLGARPEYKQYALTDPVLLKQAYNFVRACQEELPKFVETEVAPQATLAARPPRLPDGPVVTFGQAAVQITNLAPRAAKKRFEQFLNEDLDYRAVTPLFRDSGVPEKVINRLAQEFARWNSGKKEQTNLANTQKSRKKS